MTGDREDRTGDRLRGCLLTVVKGILHTGGEPEDVLGAICQLLRENLDGYDWVGFYLVDREHPGTLVLGPFVGEPTEHVRIPFGTGICGQAAAGRRAYLARDVSREGNYLSCSPNVRSEIVVPIIRGREVLGEIDVDSHRPDNFDEDDVRFLEELARLVEPHL